MSEWTARRRKQAGKAFQHGIWAWNVMVEAACSRTKIGSTADVSNKTRRDTITMASCMSNCKTCVGDIKAVYFWRLLSTADFRLMDMLVKHIQAAEEKEIQTATCIVFLH